MKIHIIGSVGSGKSTLARKLSRKYDVPYFELDNVVWRRTNNGDIRNSPEARDEKFHSIIGMDSWIVEGVHHTWVSEGFEKAELIIFLDTPVRIRNYRIAKRFVVQKLGFEKGNYKQTIHILKNMYKWNYHFENKSKPEILSLLEQYEEKLLIVKDNDRTDEISAVYKALKKSHKCTENEYQIF